AEQATTKLETPVLRTLKKEKKNPVQYRRRGTPRATAAATAQPVKNQEQGEREKKIPQRGPSSSNHPRTLKIP
ncbi:hypothetical protein Tco_0380783, partial [Tanacetum coccineum]